MKRTLETALGLIGGILSFIFGVMAIADAYLALFPFITFENPDKMLVLVAGILFAVLGIVGIAGALQATRKIKAAEVMLLVPGIVTIIISVFGFWPGYIGSVLILIAGILCTVRKPKEEAIEQKAVDKRTISE